MRTFNTVPPPMPKIKTAATPANPFVSGGGLVVTHDPYMLFPDVFSDIMREADRLTEIATEKLSMCADMGSQRAAVAWHKQAILGQNLKLAAIQTMAKSQEVVELRKRNNESSGSRSEHDITPSSDILNYVDPMTRKTVIDIIARRVAMEQVVPV